MQKNVLATYLIETPMPLERAAEIMAGEQSTGTFTAVPGETEAVKQRYGAQVTGIKPLEPVSSPTLPGAAPADAGQGYNRGEVTLSFPLHNFGPSIPNLLSAVAGNLFELEAFSGLRLLDLELPDEFSSVYPGPRFGIKGTRELAGVTGRPLIGTIIKPSVGLTIDELRLYVRELALSGVDFIKDDELNADPPYAPLKEKVKAVMEEIERVADRTGKKVMYAFNITADIGELLEHHDRVVEAGGTCVMVSLNSIGLAGLAHLRKHSELPIHGHRNQWGMWTRCPLLGMEFTAFQKLCRLAGADHLHVNGLNSKFYESNESVIRSVKACLRPLFEGYLTMPVLSSGQSAATVAETYARTNTFDVIHLAGGGIMAHPDGVAAGAASMKEAWAAAMAGISPVEYAKTHPSLRHALEKFGHGK